MDLLSNLTPAQRQAVTHIDGPLLILAGPGSGKTRVITRRVAYLLSQGVKPWNILAITFTNKAAGEMRRRVEDLAPHSKVWMSTFHSMGARLLRRYADVLGLDRNFTIYDQADRNAIVKEALAAANIDNVHYTPERVQAAISRAKNQLLSPPEYARTANDFFGQTVARVYPIYEKLLKNASALDFDDLLYWMAYLLRNHPEVRAELDDRFRYVLVDEYQDTNHAQYMIARSLCINYPNLCVVGDPDQSIYRFRGSDIRNILDFEHDYPDALVITLDRNYRSTKNILDAADRIIAHNTKRKTKTLVTENPSGDPVAVRLYPDGEEEAEAIARHIQRTVQSQDQNGKQGPARSYRDFAIFLRVNALSRALEQAMIRRRVPYQMVRGLAFFERKENKDILAYLRLVLNSHDDLSFMRAINEPARGIGKVSIEHLRQYASEREESLLAAASAAGHIPAIKGKAAKALTDFARMIGEIAQLAATAPADEIIRLVIDRSGYRQMLRTSADELDQERLANIEELITAAHLFLPEDGEQTVAAFLEHVTLVNDVDAWDESVDKVSIMTLHAAKGLEFPVVFMPAMEQGLLPHERSQTDPEELEEERRLAFVGMTRAKEHLILSNVQRREFRGVWMYKIPSQFLTELPQDRIERQDLGGSERWERQPYSDDSSGDSHPDREYETQFRGSAYPNRSLGTKKKEQAASVNTDGFAVGATVRHKMYGIGKIVEASGFGDQRKVKIRFATEGLRTFIVAKAPLEMVRAGS
ncbi:MAG: ATP-dependent DNA helicase [Acidobacteria bacterium]|nr:MAG: ATP-dependent DNA helicase [Acidobacteriota bacterium]